MEKAFKITLPQVRKQGGDRNCPGCPEKSDGGECWVKSEELHYAVSACAQLGGHFSAISSFPTSNTGQLWRQDVGDLKGAVV